MSKVKTVGKNDGKYHISKNGTLEKCRAFFRVCPREVHFASQEDGEHYLDVLETLNVKYPTLIGSKLIEPSHNFACLADELTKEEKDYLFNGQHISKDAFVVIPTEEDVEEGMSKVFIHAVLGGKMAKEDFGRGLYTLEDTGEDGRTRAIFNGKVFLEAPFYEDYKGYRMQDKTTLEERKEYVERDLLHLLEAYWGRYTLLARNMGYRMYDKLWIDGKTKIRVFTHDKVEEIDTVDLDMGQRALRIAVNLGEIPSGDL